MYGNKSFNITGLAPNNTFKEINSDAFGHLEVAIHGPPLPFGSVHSEGLRSVLQFDGVHKIVEVPRSARINKSKKNFFPNIQDGTCYKDNYYSPYQ